LFAAAAAGEAVGAGKQELNAGANESDAARADRLVPYDLRGLFIDARFYFVWALGLFFAPRPHARKREGDDAHLRCRRRGSCGVSSRGRRRPVENAMPKARTAVAVATIFIVLGAETAGGMTVPVNPLTFPSAQSGASLVPVACQGLGCNAPGPLKPGGAFKPGGPFKPGGNFKPIPGRPFIPPHHFRPPNYRPYYRPWRNQAYFGAIIAGVTLGAIIATAVNAAPPPPSPDLCWYWNDPSLTSGYWDYCQ